MVTVPLGQQAYARNYAGAPEIRLVNRYVESSPSNQREHSSLLSRPGTTALLAPPGGRIRAHFSKIGLFGGDLFVVSGANLYRFTSYGELIAISGTIGGSGFVYATWAKGIGYEFLFLSDGQTVQYYSTHAIGTLTLSGGSITDFAGGGQVIEIGGTYYAWSANVNTGTPAGTSVSPYLALLGSAVPDGDGLTGDASSLSAMAELLNFSGVSGATYSATLTGPNPNVSAAALPTTLTVTAIADLAIGDLVTTSIFSGTHLAWGATTLTGGGNQALQPVPGMGTSEAPKALAEVSGYVLVSVAGTSKFYWIDPGEVIINPLNFASKESNPDAISDMQTVGDNVAICGDGSTESWYATGDLAAPFAPIEGRVFKRGVLEGTAVPIKDSLVVVGEDGVVYSIGNGGESGNFGVNRISTHGIEERIRIQMRNLQGLSP